MFSMMFFPFVDDMVDIISLQIRIRRRPRSSLASMGKNGGPRDGLKSRGEGWREELIPGKPKVIVALLKGRCFKMMCANFMDERCWL